MPLARRPLAHVARSGCTADRSRRHDLPDPIREAPAAVSASGPVSRSAPVGGSGSASTAAATSAMSRGSIHAIRPSPVGNTRRPRRSSVELARDSTGCEERRLQRPSTRPATPRAALDRAVIAVQAGLETGDREVRDLHDVLDAGRLRRDDRIGLQRDLILRGRAHQEHSLHVRERRGRATADHRGRPARRSPHRRQSGFAERVIARTSASRSATNARATSRAQITGRSDHEHSHAAESFGAVASCTCASPAPDPASTGS